jgi:hypothetical protein
MHTQVHNEIHNKVSYLQLSKYTSYLGNIQLKDTAHGQNFYFEQSKYLTQGSTVYQSLRS